jgi:predicted SnoaL-like aldol condensation-catalyzing enzyme
LRSRDSGSDPLASLVQFDTDVARPTTTTSGDRRRFSIAAFLLGAPIPFGPAPVYTGMTTGDQNKQIAVAFWNRVFTDRDPGGAVAAYVGASYTQHNPDTADGPSAFIQSMIENLRGVPNMRAEIKRVVAEGDLVVIHNHITSGAGDRGLAGFDLFRLNDGKIVEHWDARQPVPEHQANGNTMF